MKFFGDPAFPNAVAEIAQLGCLSGVTTNPSLAAKTGRPYQEVATEICTIAKAPVSAQVTAQTTGAMVAEGQAIHSWNPEYMVVKLPLTAQGLAACRTLTDQGIKTNLTLCFSSAQALLAARAGATYVSPFIGRLDDIGEDGIGLIADIADIFAIHDIQTEIIAASVRTVDHITAAALAGADIATIPPKLFAQMLKHDLTDKGLEAFLGDWNAAQAAAAAAGAA